MRRPRRWECPGICRLIILNSLGFFCSTVGEPPVVSGVTPPAGRPKKKKKLSRYGGGFRKSTPELIRESPEETIDCLSTFFLVIHIYYCMHLDPPVDQGSEAEIAVFKTLMGDNCKTQLLKSIKTKFQVKCTTCSHDTLQVHAPTTHSEHMPPRHAPTTPFKHMLPRHTLSTCSHVQKWTNKTLAVECIDELYDWVRAGTSKDERVSCLQALGGRSNDEEPTEQDRECQSLVVKALVRYSKGMEGAKVFPYSKKAHNNTDEFLQIPSTTLSITFSCMYPFIVQDKSTHENMLKSCLYPIKQLWPKSVLKRYMNFNDKFTALRFEMFDSYEKAGGTYHGAPDKSDDEEIIEEKEYENVELDCDKDF